jgi:opacity protein-like surface antigen
MKRLFAGAVLSIALVSPVSAGLWDTAVTSGWPTIENVTKYKVSTHGYDVRVYEWTPKDNKNVRCVFVAGSENSSGVACYPVEDKVKTRK